MDDRGAQGGDGDWRGVQSEDRDVKGMVEVKK